MRAAAGAAGIVIGTSWLAGIWLGSLLSPPSPAIPALLALVALLLGLLLRRTPGALSLAIGSAALLCGAMRYGAAAETVASANLPVQSEHIVRVRGWIDQDPTRQGRWVDLVVQAEELGTGDHVAPVKGRLLARTDGLAEWRYGDVVELYGRLAEPTSYEGFSYRDHLARQGIRALMRYPRVSLVARDRAPWPLLWLSRARASATALVSRHVPEPAGSLAQGILIGERAAISDELLDAFARTNTAHIVAVSGMNIALVVGLIQPFAKRLPGRWLGLAATTAAITLYSALAGLQPPVLRAALMGGLVGWGRSIGRQSDALSALGLAGLVLTAVNPWWLWDLGFQLSFAATAGLIVLAPPIEARLLWLQPTVRSIMAVTLAAQAATLPLTALAFGQLSLIAPLANLLVVPAIGPATIASLMTVALGLVAEPLGATAGWTAWLLLSYVCWAVERCAALPWSSLPIGHLASGLGVLYYVALLSVAGFVSAELRGLLTPGLLWTSLTSRLRARWLLPFLVGVVVLAWAGAASARISAPLITFLDVGQGDAILVQTPSGRNVLIDGGPDPDAIVGALGRRLPFWQRRLDLVVLTHPHDDHLVGLTEVLTRYEVAQVLEPELVHTTAAVSLWEARLRERSTPRTLARAGQVIDLGDRLALEVLHPMEPARVPSVGARTDPSEGVKDAVNARSVVLRLKNGEQAVLLMGDAGAEVQRALLARTMVEPAAVLKVPHHGAADALDPGFLDRCSPRIAVISVGQRNRSGHPSPRTLGLLEGVSVYRTDVSGSVEVALDEGGIRLRTER